MARPEMTLVAPLPQDRPVDPRVLPTRHRPVPSQWPRAEISWRVFGHDAINGPAVVNCPRIRTAELAHSLPPAKAPCSRLPWSIMFV